MHETAVELSPSVISAQQIIREYLKFSKVSARWIPTQLIGFNKVYNTCIALYMKRSSLMRWMHNLLEQNVFRECLKMAKLATDVDFCIFSGSKFQAWGPVYENARQL